MIWFFSEMGVVCVLLCEMRSNTQVGAQAPSGYPYIGDAQQPSEPISGQKRTVLWGLQTEYVRLLERNKNKDFSHRENKIK